MGTEGEGRPGRTVSHPRSFEQLSKGPSDIKPGRTTNCSGSGGLCPLLISKLQVETMEAHW